MRITQVVPSLEERHGGPSKSAYALSATLVRQGHTVELLATAPDAGEQRREGELTVQTYPRTGPRVVCASRGLRERLRESSAEVVHHHALWLRTLHYAHRAAARQDIPLVISPRGMMSGWAWRHRRAKKIVARLVVTPGAFSAASGWHATSEEEAADIRARGFTQPICVAPNGVSEPSAAAIADSVRHWSKACPEVGSRPIAVFYSRLHRKKRVVELIDAWLEHAPRDWLLLVVGIPQEYSVHMLEEYVLRSLGSDRVKIFNGLGRPAPYAIASLFLLPSHNENFGLAIAESMAHGVPVLVADGTPWGRVNEEGVGWCVSWQQFPETLRAAMAEGPARLQLRGAKAKAWILREYSWEEPARVLTDFYAQLRRGGRG